MQKLQAYKLEIINDLSMQTGINKTILFKVLSELLILSWVFKILLSLIIAHISILFIVSKELLQVLIDPLKAFFGTVIHIFVFCRELSLLGLIAFRTFLSICFGHEYVLYI